MNIYAYKHNNNNNKFEVIFNMLALLPKPALDILRAPTLAYKLSQGIGTNQLYNKNTNHLIAC